MHIHFNQFKTSMYINITSVTICLKEDDNLNDINPTPHANNYISHFMTFLE